MKISFGYIHYRIKKRFYKKDSDGFVASALLAIMQVLVIVDLAIVLSKFFLTRHETAPYAKLLAQIAAGITVLVFFYNYKKYDKKYWTFWERWKNETPGDRLKNGWLVFLAVIAPLAFLILIGVYQ